jgi:hypothetical protein
MDSTALCLPVTRPCGAMDSASDFGSESCGFESRQGLFFCSFFLLAGYSNQRTYPIDLRFKTAINTAVVGLVFTKKETNTWA